MYGTLTFDRHKSRLDLWEVDGVGFLREELGSKERIDGILDDGRCVSLIRCLGLGKSTYINADVGHHHHFYPHFVVVGGPRFSGEISQVSFLIDDAESLFVDRGAFGPLLLDEEESRELLRRKNIPVEDDAHPSLSYWSGKFKILSADTPIGRVSVSHNPTRTLQPGTPAATTNEVSIGIDFPDPIDIWELQRILGRILRFLGIVIGRPQNLLKVEIHNQFDQEPPLSSSVYLNGFPSRPQRNERKQPNWFDTLIDAGNEPSVFANLLSAWLSRDDKWTPARVRFMDGWGKQGSYGADRIVGAANLFDLSPGDAAPAARPLPNDLSRAIERSQALFSELPENAERDSILGYLGQVGKPTLKNKIKHRAETYVTVALGKDLPELDLVIDAAVELRHLYVHGDRSNQRRAQLADHCTIFLTNTLEFIFGVSDLVESGWDLGQWRHQQALGFHPFANYLEEYAKGLAALKRVWRVPS